MSDWIRTAIADTKAGTGLERENREKLERRLLGLPLTDPELTGDHVDQAVNDLIARGL